MSGKRKKPHELKYGVKGEKHKDPKKLKEYVGPHPTLDIECLITEYEDGFVLYRDIKNKTFLPGCIPWGPRKGRRGRCITTIIDEIADSETWLALMGKHFALTDSKDEEVRLRAIGQLLDRYFGKAVQNQSIEVGSKDSDAIKSKLNDLFGINDEPDSLEGETESNESTEATDDYEGEAQ